MQQSNLTAALPELGALFDGEPVDRDVAWWQHIVRVFERLNDAYRPTNAEPCPPGLRPFYTDLGGLAEACVPDSSGKPGATAIALGQWRAHVLGVECENARRLEIVADAVARLREMRERTQGRPPDLKLLDDMVRDLSGFIYAHYRVVPPPDAKLRLWCSRQTRRNDLLPGEWRML